LNELALFAGAGGGLLGSRLLGFRAVCYVENDPYCVSVLKARIADGYLDDAPIWDDARTFDGRPWRGCVDILSAGFPCQPFSVAGRRKGEDDERNLWPDTIRIIREVAPPWVFLENVPGITPYLPTIRGDLIGAGYRWRRPIELPACALGAVQQRQRLWFAADAYGLGDEFLSQDPVCPRGASSEPSTWWDTEPGVCRVDDGAPNRLDRARAIGQAQVPRVVAEAWRLLMERLTG